NNLLLIAIFLSVRFSRQSELKMFARAYLMLSLPTLYLIYAALTQGMSSNYVIFLMIFIAFLSIDFLYDFVLKVSFRKSWKLLVPYLMLYWSMNYGFFVMAWKYNKVQGSIIIGLFFLQLTSNILSHSKKSLSVRAHSEVKK
ncbi:MAG: hypothetical protein AAGU75_24150, partial [Bacillota bacterium]